MIDIKPQSQETQIIPSRINHQNTTSRHIILKLKKISEKNKIEISQRKIKQYIILKTE